MHTSCLSTTKRLCSGDFKHHMFCSLLAEVCLPPELLIPSIVFTHLLSCPSPLPCPELSVTVVPALIGRGSVILHMVWFACINHDSGEVLVMTRR